LQAHRCLQLVDPAFTDTWRFLTDKALSGDDLFVVVPGKTFKVNVAEAMSSAAEAGMGICLLPDYVAASALQRGSLVRLLPHFHLQEKTLYALYPSRDPKSTRLNSSHVKNSYAVFCLKKKKTKYVM